ncbi:MAG TPA: hypothetical protein VGZ93_06180 [Candidatus Methylacidiphilales bacterium]|jgi:ABC-type multidrug transport system permease subunit|nr:hypothetical protein [Candidatus Methylacidiphilales bacterium]
MNENPPSESEGSKPPSLLTKTEAPPKTPSFGAMFALGIVLFILSIALCIPFQSPTVFFLGAAGAFVTVFFKGYRSIFVGYISTLGLVLLGIIIYCANHPFDMR